MVSERSLGTAADIAAAMQASQAALLPERTRQLVFGEVAAAWGVLQDLGVAAIIDEVTGARPAGLPLPAGTYLALAALNRLVAPCSKLGFADWWRTTAADRFTRIPASALDHRRFWDAMHAVTAGQLEEISRRMTVRTAPPMMTSADHIQRSRRLAPACHHHHHHRTKQPPAGH